MKIENEKLQRQIIHLMKELRNNKKRENNSTLDIYFNQYGNTFSMFENIKEVDEETVTKENTILLTREPLFTTIR